MIHGMYQEALTLLAACFKNIFQYFYDIYLPIHPLKLRRSLRLVLDTEVFRSIYIEGQTTNTVVIHLTIHCKFQGVESTPKVLFCRRFFSLCKYFRIHLTAKTINFYRNVE